MKIFLNPVRLRRFVIWILWTDCFLFFFSQRWPCRRVLPSSCSSPSAFLVISRSVVLGPVRYLAQVTGVVGMVFWMSRRVQLTESFLFYLCVGGVELMKSWGKRKQKKVRYDDLRVLSLLAVDKSRMFLEKPLSFRIVVLHAVFLFSNHR